MGLVGEVSPTKILLHTVYDMEVPDGYTGLHHRELEVEYDQYN